MGTFYRWNGFTSFYANEFTAVRFFRKRTFGYLAQRAEIGTAVLVASVANGANLMFVTSIVRGIHFSRKPHRSLLAMLAEHTDETAAQQRKRVVIRLIDGRKNIILAHLAYLCLTTVVEPGMCWSVLTADESG